MPTSMHGRSRFKGTCGNFRLSDVSAYGPKSGELLRECSWLIVTTEEWKMRQTTGTRKSPSLEVGFGPILLKNSDSPCPFAWVSPNCALIPYLIGITYF
jgi:hypothetical protein